MPDSPFTDPAAFLALPRITALTLSADGSRLVATVAAPNAEVSAYTSALWEIDLAGRREPARLTFSAKGESGAAFLPDGALLFTSARPDDDAPDSEDSALWRLPPTGEATVLARTSGGLTGPVVAAGAPVVVLGGSRLAGPDGSAGTAGNDEERRKHRRDTKSSAILHDGMPLRYWDHELGETSPRLFLISARGDVSACGAAADASGEGVVRDLAPDAGTALLEAAATIDSGGGRVLVTWMQREPHGRTRTDLISIDVASGTRKTLLSEPDTDFGDPLLDRTGSAYAVLRRTRGTFSAAHREVLQIHRAGAPVIEVQLGDLTPTDYAWVADGTVLYVAGDLHGAGAVLAVDAADGRVTRRLVSDAAYSHLRPAPDGRSLYALRSAVDRPATPVRLDTTATDQRPEFLPAPGDVGALPGRLTRVEQQVGDVTVSGWLCLPSTGPDSDAQALLPLMTWVHGGPFGSWNAWSWRWCPWVAVARGYAVLLPDPALSTGYGEECIARAWPHRAAVVWREVEALTDRVLDDPAFALDPTRTCLLGASFGGYMTNWIAGHTDRFRAIVTHAGLWALDQQHATTDMAAWKTGIFGRPEDHPEWYAENSPDRFVSHIGTPMLLVHGNRDYRVPVSEALRLWWDLVSGWEGAPENFPHRFLQFTGENHWVLNPSNAVTWYETVLDFCDRHTGAQPG